MAKKVLSIVLAVAMLLGTFAVASLAGNYYSYTPEEAEAEVAEKLWYVDYDADVDWKEEIDRRWLTGSKLYDGSAASVAPQEILEYNLFFWADEIIAEYNAASSNEDYWNLYNKMATPEILYFTYDDGGEMVTECDIFYDYAYEYRDESKAVMDINIVADKEYAKAGDIITVDVYATSNFNMGWILGGIFYDKSVLKPLEIIAPETDTGWILNQDSTQLDLAVKYDADGNVTFDRRDDFWPEAMYTEENLNKYGVSYIYSYGDETLGIGNYVHGRKFNNEIIFTATYEVKEGVADGTEIEFFIPDDVIAKFQDVGYAEWGNGEDASVWNLYRVDYPGTTKATYDLVADFNSFYDHTVKANVETITIGEEPAPATKGEIVDVYLGEAYVGDVTKVDVEVTGSPEALHFMEADGGYKRVARETATIVEFNGNELWTVDLFVEDELLEYTVYADYGELGSTDGKEFVIVGQVKADYSIHSIEVPDMYGGMGGMILAGKHDVIIKTSTDVVKVQLYAEDGTTYTYTSWSGAGKMPYEDIDGERVWTISHSFGPFGYSSLAIRTRTETSTFVTTNTTLDATVVY